MDLDDLIEANVEKKEIEEKTSEITFVQIYYEKRNMRKSWTIIEGMKVNKDFIGKIQKKFSCNASVESNGNIRMTGTHKRELIDYLREELGIENIKVN